VGFIEDELEEIELVVTGMSVTLDAAAIGMVVVDADSFRRAAANVLFSGRLSKMELAVTASSVTLDCELTMAELASFGLNVEDASSAGRLGIDVIGNSMLAVTLLSDTDAKVDSSAFAAPKVTNGGRLDKMELEVTGTAESVAMRTESLKAAVDASCTSARITNGARLDELDPRSAIDVVSLVGAAVDCSVVAAAVAAVDGVVEVVVRGGRVFSVVAFVDAGEAVVRGGRAFVISLGANVVTSSSTAEKLGTLLSSKFMKAAVDLCIRKCTGSSSASSMSSTGSSTTSVILLGRKLHEPE
jgi:hypothetical protein